MGERKVTILDFKNKKERGEKITMLTAYDCPMAVILDTAGIDAVLVGDSLGMVLLGYDSTVCVTMDEMIHHARAVRKGVKRAFLIGDMPFMSYQASDEDAVRNAGRFVQEAGCEAVKVEGGREILPRIKAIINAGIPVVGHIGLTPQNASKLGGYRVQGRDAASSEKIIEDAVLLEDAGCFSVILECVPSGLASTVTGRVKIPVIGIGAGGGCDGQVLVTADLTGYFVKYTPKFVKRYAEVNKIILEAVKSFKQETESGDFPGDEYSF
ncbi:MAG: 3-methyl-2-oxobutanoate hydroxymethyltransferase [Candidatus Omnitrophota bacterium]